MPLRGPPPSRRRRKPARPQAAVRWSDRSSRAAPRFATTRASSPAPSSSSVPSRRKPFMSDYATTLSRRIATHTARLSIIGQGYVGLPLAVEFAQAGFPVTGLAAAPDRVAALASGRSHVPDVPSEQLQALLRAGRYHATSAAAILQQIDADCV